MNERSSSAELMPEELLSLAASMAQRNISEQQWQQTILAETIPLPPSPPTEVIKSIHTGATVAMLKTLENPDTPIDFFSVIRAVVDDKTIADILRSTGDEPDEESIAILRALLDGQVKTMVDMFSLDQHAQQRMKRQVQAAKSIADTHTVEIAEVFTSDSLYGELMGTLYSPQTYIAENVAANEKLTGEFVMASMGNMVDALLQTELVGGEISGEEYETAKAEMTAELLEDKQTLSELDVTMSAIRMAGQRVIIRGIERFWGKSAIEGSEALLGSLALEQAANTSLPESLRRQQGYNDTIATLCMERGWDPTNLTMAQTRELNSTLDVRNRFDDA